MRRCGSLQAAPVSPHLACPSGNTVKCLVSGVHLSPPVHVTDNADTGRQAALLWLLTAVCSVSSGLSVRGLALTSSHSQHHTLTRYLPPHSHCCTCDPPLLGTSAHVVHVFRPGGRGQESAGGWRCSRCHTSDVSCCWAGKGEHSQGCPVLGWWLGRLGSSTPGRSNPAVIVIHLVLG